MNKYDKKHIANVRGYQRRIDDIYKKAVEQITMRSAGLDAPDGYIFTFDDFPALRKQIDALISKMQSDIEFTVTDGVRAEWDLANAKNDALVGTLPDALSGLAKYHRTNEDALSAFLGRKQGGLGLSENVWKYATQFKDEIEMGLDVGIRDGLDAASMARQLKQYLQFPDMLFRRVRDEHGVLHLSQRAAAFHPGQGVYRSSYKNARRLAATETNMAYRTSDHERWQDLDFIVGIEIHLSNNHTCLNIDICDELQGKYPKEFKFVGWHPHCRCIATPIMKTKAELDADDERLKRGEEPSDPSTSENAVTDMPDGWKQWMEDNAERIENAKSMPYFIRDNFKDGDPSAGLRWMNRIAADEPRQLTALEVAEQRHAARTAGDIESIRMDWYYRQTKNLEDDIRNGLLPESASKAISKIRTNLFYDLDDAQRRISMLQAAVRRHAARTAGQMQIIQDAWNQRRALRMYEEMSGSTLSHDVKTAIVQNNLEIEKQIGIIKGKPMTIDEADLQSANPFYSKGREYHINCSACTPTYMMRTRGFDVTAGANVAGTQINYLSKGNAWDVWLNADGTAATHESVVDWLASKNGKTMTQKRWIEFIEEKTADEGIYSLSLGWKGGGGHITILQRTRDGKLLYIEPQLDNHLTREDIVGLVKSAAGKQHRLRGIMRIDDKLFNPKFISIFVKK